MITLSTLDKRASFLNVVAIPFVMIFVYFTLIAADFYTSEAIITIKENANNSSGFDLGLLSIGSSSGIEDERLLKEYFFTGDMLDFLDKTVGHKSHYQHSGADWFSALSSDANKEDYLEYYRDHIDVNLDETSSLLFIEVQAYDNKYAKQLLEIMLQHAENVLNEITHNLAMAQYEFVEKQLIGSQKSLKNAKKKLQAFQNEHQMFSPEQQGQSLTAIKDTLESQLSQDRANLKQLLSSQKADSPQVVVAKTRIRALTEQIMDEKRRLVGQGSDSLNDLLMGYTNLQLELGFAKDAYASTLAALEQSRAEASRKIKHLVVLSKPSLAEEPKYPDKSYILFTVLVVLLMLFGIVRMMISTIREHQD